MWKIKLFGPIIRHLLTAGGGALVASGYIDAAAADQLAGAGMALFGVALSLIDKRAVGRG